MACMGSGLLHDIRYGIRGLRRTPGLTAVAVTSLALGIGANLAIFGFIDAALFKPLAVDRPGDLVSVYFRPDKAPDTYAALSYPEFEFLRARNTVFTGMLAYLRVPMVEGNGADSARISGELVSPDYFAVLGLRPVAGHFFQAGERGDVAVIAETFWRARFGGDPATIGKTLQIGRGSFTVIGVAPGSFRGIVMDWADPPSVWLPVDRYAEAVPAFPFDITRAWGMESYLVTARLRPGVAIAQAEAQMQALTARMAEEGHARQARPLVFGVQQARFWPSYRGSILTFLGALMGIVGAILLIACCNVANLLLARGANRRREMAMRLAIGAGRGRIARQLLVEGVLLAAGGGVAALAVGAAASVYLAQFHRAFGIPLAIESGWDVRVVAFAIGLSAATGLLFGLAPLAETLRVDLGAALKAGATGSGNPRSILRSCLLIAQVALCTILLAGAGLFLRTLQKAAAESPAQGASRLLLARLEPSTRGFAPPREQQFYAEVLRRVRAIPGVASAALVFVVPFGGMRGGTDIVAPDGSRRQVDFNVVSPRYFQTAGAPLLAGRDFRDSDAAASPPAALVNERLAARFWPHESPIGKSIREVRPDRVWTVVGVVRDGKMRGYRDELRPGFYVPAAQADRGEMTLEARTSGPAVALASAVRREIQAADPSVPVTDVETMETWLADSLSQERLIASFSAGLAALALVLAAIGIYGVLSFSVSRRTREIGVRMALGARPAEVSALVLWETARLAGAGLAIGAAGALTLARSAKALLYGVTPADPAAFTAALALLALAAAGSSLLPALRAARLDPAATLRAE